MSTEIGWHEYPQNLLFYCFASAADHLGFFLLGCVVLFFVSKYTRKGYGKLLKQWILFSLILFLISAALGGVWDIVIYGRFYVTADYVSDFSPFIPVTQNVIDVHFDDYNGHLIGITLRQLQLIWLMFALVSWSLAILIYMRVRTLPFSFGMKRLTKPHIESVGTPEHR